MPVFNNALAGAASGGAAGDFKIERSLRFNSGDNAYLDRSPQTAGNRKKWTWSGWIKTTTSSTYRALIEGYGGTPAGANRTSFQLNNVGKLHILFDNGNSGQLLTSGQFRDPSSWFHVVLAVDTSQIAPINRVKIYVNGRLLESGDYDTASYPSPDYLTGINNNQPHYINRVVDPKWGDWYAADIHLVDGQQLDCTSFGEFDDDTGVWNPKRYSGSHGTNGFYLDFSDDSSADALGYDAAGSNNWNVNSLGVSKVDYTNSLTSQSLDTSVVSGSVSNIFNGDTSDKYEWSVSGTGVGDSGTFTITFNPALNVTNGLRVHAWLNDNQYDKHGISVNGGSYYYPNIYDGSNQWHDLLDTSYSNNTGFTGGTLNSLSFRVIVDMSGQNPTNWVRAIEVNGVQLTDSDVDVFRDSPSNYDDGTNIGGNYATFNPVDCDNGTLSNGNLTTNQTNTNLKFGPQNTTMGFSSGKWYCEFTWDSGIYALVGITHQPSTGLTGTTWHRDAETYTWYFSGAFMSAAWPGTSTFPDGSNPQFTAGDVIGVLLDKDNDKLYFTKNGSYVASMNAATGANGIDISAHSGKTAFFTVGNNASTATQWTLNAGQRPFAASSIPTGYKALCTQNFDDPPIANGKNHFDTQTWTGASTNSAVTVTGFKFSPEFIWAKSRSHAYSNNLYDIVRGTGKGLYSDNNGTEVTNSQYGYVSQFNSNGFTASAGSSDNDFFNGTNKTYVAFGWNAGDTNTPVSAGSLNTSSYLQGDIYSGDLSTNDALSNVTNAFDGNLTTRAQTANSGTFKELTWAPSPAVSFTQSFEVYCDQGNNTPTATWDGNTVSPGGGKWVTVYSGSGTINSSTPLVITTNGASQYATLVAVRLDGKILVDNNITPANVPSVVSTHRADTTAGFSIVTWTASAAGNTVAHGLGKKPEMIITKSRTTASQPWAVYHSYLGKGGVLLLDEVSGNSSNWSTYWGYDEPNSNVFGTYTGQTPWANNAGDMVAYCFSEIKGYSQFGHYHGNSSSSGPFIYTGFRPAWIMVKKVTNADANSGWHIYDAKRDPYNRVENWVLAESPYYENRAANNTADMGGHYNWDFYSNGFRPVHSSNNLNQSNSEYIYAAFAENPFKTARAR